MSAQPKPASPLEPSQRAARMPRSSIRRIYNAAKALEAQGHQVLPLHIGDPDFDIPPRVAVAVTRAMAEGHTHYSPVPGIPPLREAIAAHLSRKLELSGLGWDQVVASQGATQALNANWLLTCNAGDQAILPMVYFPNYMQQLSINGIRPAFYPFNASFQPELDRLADLVEPRSKVLLVNTPSNPTGALFPPATVRALYAFARQHNLWLISDEAYIDYVYEGEYLSPLQIDWEYPPAERRVLGIFSFSKSYAVTGLRMGFTVCPRPDVAAQLALLSEPLSGSLTTPLQYGMVAALAEDDTAERRASLDRRRRVAAQVLNDNGFPVTPVAGGMFYFLDISVTGLNSDEFADALLAEEHVAVVPGAGFGLAPQDGPDGPRLVPNDLASRCIRLCFGLPEELLVEGVKRIATFIQRHRSTK